VPAANRCEPIVNIMQIHHDPLQAERFADLVRMVPQGLVTALDVGARHGYLSTALAESVQSVTALDLAEISIDHPRVTAVRGDARRLQFADRNFDLVVCAEVLEHIAGPGLQLACTELERVTARFLLIGVPYRQDLRVGRTTCRFCGQRNPPWGHVNSFDEERLIEMFSGMKLARKSFVGSSRERTNNISTALYDWAGNPWGTYSQLESCISCGSELAVPKRRNMMQQVSSRVAHLLNEAQRPFVKPRPNWIHVLFEKKDRS
jgi:hypothetical protein